MKEQPYPCTEDNDCLRRAEAEKEKRNPNLKIAAQAKCSRVTKTCVNAGQYKRENDKLSKDRKTRFKEAQSAMRENFMPRQRSPQLFQVIENYGSPADVSSKLSSSSRRTPQSVATGLSSTKSKTRSSSSSLPKKYTPVFYESKPKAAADLFKNSTPKDIKDLIKQLQNDKITLQNGLKELQWNWDKCKQVNDRLVKDNNRLVEEKNKKITKLREKDKKELQKIVDQIEREQRNVKLAKEENDMLKKRIKGLLAQLDQERDMLRAEKARLDKELNQELAAARKEYEFDKKKLEIARKELEKDREVALKELEKREMELKNTKDELLKEKADAEENMKALNLLRGSLNSQRKSVKCDEIRASISELQKLGKYKKQVERLKAQLKKEKEKLKKLKAKAKPKAKNKKNK